MVKHFIQKKTFGTYGRTGELFTRRGVVKTPTFMPDGTRGAVKGLMPDQVTETGVEIVLANTYHLYLQPGEKTIKKLGGLHAFANRAGPILTDSGGFQVFSLGKHTKVTEEGVKFKDPTNGDERFISPEFSIQIQIDLGADIIVAFDHLVGLKNAKPSEVKDAFDRTHRWLERCIVEFKRLTRDMEDNKRPMLFGVVQGGLDLDLRRKSLEIVQKSGVDGIAIGGLSVGETRQEMEQVLKALAPLYDPEKPRFLLGVGTPEDLKIAVEYGIDMLDCVLPTRNARHATVWTHTTPCACLKKTGQVEPVEASRPSFAFVDQQSSRNVPLVRLVAVADKNNETRLECKTCATEYISEKIHLTNEKYKLDTGVIEEGCDCYTCKKGFTKAFLRHQFKVSDPLAGSLASIHNLRHMMRLCESYRQAKPL